MLIMKMMVISEENFFPNELVFFLFFISFFGGKGMMTNLKN